MQRSRSVSLVAAWALAVLFDAQAQMALAQDPARPPSAAEMDDDESEGGSFLMIPGIGKIPMPPGVHVFGPGNSGRPPPSKRAAPEPPKAAPPSQPVDAVARLFERLAEAADEQEAQAVATSILRHWAHSGSDTVDLLVTRAAAAETGGAQPLARSLLDYVVTLAPYWSEGFVRRARAKAAQGDVNGALDDLETAARLEPKRFDALASIGALYEAAGDKKRALDAYRRALAISPRQDALRKTEERLRLEIEGRDI